MKAHREGGRRSAADRLTPRSKLAALTRSPWQSLLFREYAALGGSAGKYWWGEEVRGKDSEVMANCDGCGSRWDNKKSAPVGSFAANPYGLMDKHRNVWDEHRGAGIEDEAAESMRVGLTQAITLLKNDHNSSS